MGRSLKGQVAVVAGGGRGIGRAIAEGLAAKGAAVTVIAHTAEQLDETAGIIKGSGGQALAIPADITDSNAIDRVVERTEECFGPVGILINSAAVSGPAGPAWNQDVHDVRKALEINVLGQFLLTCQVMRGMAERRQGRIINVLNGAEYLRRGFVGFSAYATSMAALSRLTEVLATEAQGAGIRTFALSLGVVRTEMLDRAFRVAVRDLSPESAERLLEGAIPVERPVELCLRMASGESDSLSGTVLGVSDGLDQLFGRGDEISERDIYELRLRALQTL